MTTNKFQPGVVTEEGDVYTPIMCPDYLQRSVMPEYELLIAIMDRALRDALIPSIDNYIRSNARRWFSSGSTAPFTFLWIADALYITPQTVARIRKRVNPDSL